MCWVFRSHAGSWPGEKQDKSPQGNSERGGHGAGGTHCCFSPGTPLPHSPRPGQLSLGAPCGLLIEAAGRPELLPRASSATGGEERKVAAAMPPPPGESGLQTFPPEPGCATPCLGTKLWEGRQLGPQDYGLQWGRAGSLKAPPAACSPGSLSSSRNREGDRVFLSFQTRVLGTYTLLGLLFLPTLSLPVSMATPPNSRFQAAMTSPVPFLPPRPPAAATGPPRPLPASRPAEPRSCGPCCLPMPAAHQPGPSPGP